MSSEVATKARSSRSFDAESSSLRSNCSTFVEPETWTEKSWRASAHRDSTDTFVSKPPNIYSVGNPRVDTQAPPQAVFDTEKQDDWTVHVTHELAQKQNRSIVRNIRYRIMSMYRRLFLVIFLVNLAIATPFAIAKMGTPDRIAAACLGNLTAAVVIRQEHFINLLFRGFSSVPKTWPLWIRCYCAKIYNLGGMHSGCALFAVIWLVWLTGVLTHNFVTVHVVTAPTLALSWAIVVLLVMQTASAYPIFRAKFHNNFEVTHRFAGWLSVALVWGLVLNSTKDLNPPGSGMSFSQTLINTSSFWFLIVVTFCLIYPWLHLRKLDVQTEILSSHACRIYVNDRSYITSYPGSFVRLSLDPLFEWHSFAAIAEPNGTGRRSDYSVVVSKAGDWTSSIIANPPTKIWHRGVPTCGVLHVAKLFKKIVLIATGSGIGPCLAVLKAGEVESRVLWSTRSPRATFGDRVVDDVLEADRDAVIYDTGRGGRPDMVKVAYSLFVDCEAEAVVIISNPKLTYQVVYGLETRGVPAYGAIWDS